MKYSRSITIALVALGIVFLSGITYVLFVVRSTSLADQLQVASVSHAQHLVEISVARRSHLTMGKNERAKILAVIRYRMKASEDPMDFVHWVEMAKLLEMRELRPFVRYEVNRRKADFKDATVVDFDRGYEGSVVGYLKTLDMIGDEKAEAERIKRDRSEWH